MSQMLEDDFANIFITENIQTYLAFLLRHYGSLTLYVIEPYIPQNDDTPLKIKATEHYSIHDHGGRLVVAPNDIYDTPFFACGEFLDACEQALHLLLDAGALEVAILGDDRAQAFVWDMCKRLEEANKKSIQLVNYVPPEHFVGVTREALLRYLSDRGEKPRIQVKKDMQNIPAA